ncbi:hypothetical protein D9M71_628120 [compost metagenome]
MRVDLTVTGLVRLTIVIYCRPVPEQGAFQRLFGFAAVGRLGQGKQRQGLFQLGACGGNLGLVGSAAGGVFKADQIHRRALQLNLQCLAVEYCIESGNPVLMRGEAAVGVIMVVIVIVMGMGMGNGQGK